MSQSKSPSGAKATIKTKKAVAKNKAAPAVETLRIIEAPKGNDEALLPLTAEEKALSDRTLALAEEIESAVKSAKETGVLHPDAVQAMIGALCRVYSIHVEAGERYGAFSHKNPVTPTDVMVTASGLLKAANLAVFELGMWQSWTGR